MAPEKSWKGTSSKRPVESSPGSRRNTISFGARKTGGFSCCVQYGNFFMMPDSISLPHSGQFIVTHFLSGKTKTPCLPKETEAFKYSCGTTLVAFPLREKAAHSLRSQADGITSVTRPRLLASSFSRRLQGDFQVPSADRPSTKTGRSLCRGRGLTRPFPRRILYFLLSYTCKYQFVKTEIPAVAESKLPSSPTRPARRNEDEPRNEKTLARRAKVLDMESAPMAAVTDHW